MWLNGLVSSEGYVGLHCRGDPRPPSPDRPQLKVMLTGEPPQLAENGLEMEGSTWETWKKSRLVGLLSLG